MLILKDLLNLHVNFLKLFEIHAHNNIYVLLKNLDRHLIFSYVIGVIYDKLLNVIFYGEVVVLDFIFELVHKHPMPYQYQHRHYSGFQLANFNYVPQTQFYIILILYNLHVLYPIFISNNFIVKMLNLLVCYHRPNILHHLFLDKDHNYQELIYIIAMFLLVLILTYLNI